MKNNDALDPETLLRQIAGKLSTENFANRHPQDALTWLLDNADDLRQALRQSEWMFIGVKDQNTAIWQAIQNIKLGNKTDDKLIVQELHKLGFAVIRTQPPEGE